MLREFGGPAALRLEDDAPEPPASDGLVVIDVGAAGVGFVDMLMTKGEYQIRPDLPFVPGTELAGTVRSAPQGSGLVAGQRVAATTLAGAFAEVARAPAMMTFPIPDDMPDIVAAGFVVNHQTAHLALKRRGRLRAGETVLVHGAAGGVGSASIQVARALGAGKVIAIASTDDRRAAALDLGADLAFDPAGDWVAHVREATGGRGADISVDPVGGAAFDQSLRCLAPEGRLLVIGFASGTIPSAPANRLLLRSLDVVGVNFGGFLAHDQEFQHAAHRELMTWWAEGRLRPIPGTVYPLAEGARALEDFAARRVTGKPVLLIS